MQISYRSIGTIHTPFTECAGMPIQPAGAVGIKGTVEIDPSCADGLRDLDGFSHVYLLYHFHRAGPAELVVTPFLDTEPHGVFATRAPRRPNPIGLSVVLLREIDGCTLHIENVDILDGTPLLDIKPYTPEFDHHEVHRVGWLAQARGRARNEKADDRFQG